VTAEGANGCTEVATTNVTSDNTIPTVTLNNPGQLTCTQTSVTLIATGTLGTYSWTGPNGAPNSNTSNQLVVTQPGLYDVTVQTANGCSRTVSVNISQNITPPNLTASNDGPLTCNKIQVNLTATGNAVSYTWTGPAPFNPVFGANATTMYSGTYTVTATGANGCSDSRTTYVAIDTTAPSVTLSSSGQITCTQSSVTLTASGTSGNYVWRNSNGTIIPGNVPQITVNVADTYSVEVTGTNGLRQHVSLQSPEATTHLW
jgi:hypothetical protein